MTPPLDRFFAAVRLSLRIIGVAALLFSMFSTSGALIRANAQTKHLRLVSTPWSPFTNTAGKPRVALDLVHSALERIGITAETVIVEESRLTPALLNREFDGSAALWTEEQRERVLLYSQPYLENRLVLVGRGKSDVSATTLGALKGKRIALVNGYAYGDDVKKGPDEPIYVLTLGEEDSVTKLLNGDVDYTLMDELVVQYLMANYGSDARTRLAFGTTPLIKRSLHFAIQRNLPDAESIIDRFNAELRTMIADRSYNRLLNLDWIEADVDGDGRLEYVPITDQVGPNPPDRGYELFSRTPDVREPPDKRLRFYMGGSFYQDWSNVPDVYKQTEPGNPRSRSNTITFFHFTF
jgi:polar amino acid transport system substrate-binding protein